MLDLTTLDLESIVDALQDQTDYERQWLIDPRTGEVVLWTSELGIDGENPVDIDELDLTVIDPVPSPVWFGDMVDFAEGINDRRAGARLARALDGRGSFRRFRNVVYDGCPDLISVWNVMRNERALRRAVRWLVDERLVDPAAAATYAAAHPDPELP